MTNYPNSRKANIVVQDLENEVLIYDLSINKAFCLNETSALVYTLADGTKTVAEISDLMSVNLKISVIEDVVYLALNELRKANLLETEKELTDYFGGVSRREIIKRVGLASMIALPIVSSVVAPTAAQAASGVCGISCASSTVCSTPCPTCQGAGTCQSGTFLVFPPCNNIGGGCTVNGTCVPVIGVPGLLRCDATISIPCTTAGAPCSANGTCTGPGTCQ